MVGVVNRYPVEQEQVLVRAAATDVDAGGSFGARLHAGQQLYHLQHVGLAEDNRQPEEFLDGYVNHAHLGAFDFRPSAGGRYGYRVNLA